MSISWKPWARMGAASPADAHDARACGARSRAEAASSNLLALHRAVQKPAPTPHGTRARSHSPANFDFSRPCRRPRRGAHHQHQRHPRDATEEGRRRWRASLKGFAFGVSPSSGGPRLRPQKGPAALPDLMAAANAADPQGKQLPVLAAGTFQFQERLGT